MERKPPGMTRAAPLDLAGGFVRLQDSGAGVWAPKPVDGRLWGRRWPRGGGFHWAGFQNERDPPRDCVARSPLTALPSPTVIE
jgi:hypothetical protein